MTSTKSIRSPQPAARRCNNFLRDFALAFSVSAAFLLVMAQGSLAAVQPTEKSDLTRAETKTHQLADAVEFVQQDIVAELVGAKEKQLFKMTDQLLHEVSQMEVLLRGKSAATRADLYKQLDRIDAKAIALHDAAPQFAPKHLLIQRGCDRIRALTDDLHFAVSQGDTSPERIRQVIARQARALAVSTHNLSNTAEYALGDTAGRAELMASIKRLATESAKFDQVTAGAVDLDRCRAEFKTLNQAWRQVVEGIRLLPPAENLYLIRSAIRTDGIHERLFRSLGMQGERAFLTLRI